MNILPSQILFRCLQAYNDTTLRRCWCSNKADCYNSSVSTNNQNRSLYTRPGVYSFIDAEYISEYPHYFTVTNLEWKRLLVKEKYKDILIESMRFLVRDKRVIIYGFVIMDNHIHIIWHLQPNKRREAVQRDFLKYTAQQIKKDMLVNHPDELAEFFVNAKDRKYQFWERNHSPLKYGLKKCFFKN